MTNKNKVMLKVLLNEIITGEQERYKAISLKIQYSNNPYEKNRLFKELEKSYYAINMLKERVLI